MGIWGGGGGWKSVQMDNLLLRTINCCQEFQKYHQLKTFSIFFLPKARQGLESRGPWRAPPGPCLRILGPNMCPESLVRAFLYACGFLYKVQAKLSEGPSRPCCDLWPHWAQLFPPEHVIFDNFGQKIFGKNYGPWWWAPSGPTTGSRGPARAL